MSQIAFTHNISPNLPAPINVSSTEQTKAGNLIIGGILRLGQFTTANAPAGTEGALYYDTTEKKTKLYSSSAWGDLAGGWDGVLTSYTTAQRTAIASPGYGMIIYNTDSARVEYYLPPGNWAAIQAPFAGGHSCTAAIDCASEICVDGYCCNTLCTGNCNRCNVAGSLGTCTDANSDCTGNCDICSSGNCAANNALCSNTTTSCTCTGSGTVFNCITCTDDPYGVCGHPICSSYTCGQAYDNGVACATCKTCTSGSCSSFVAAGVTGLNCTATHYRCDGAGNCTAPTTNTCTTCGGTQYTCTVRCVTLCGYAGCSNMAYANCAIRAGGCEYANAESCICWQWTY